MAGKKRISSSDFENNIFVMMDCDGDPVHYNKEEFIEEVERREREGEEVPNNVMIYVQSDYAEISFSKTLTLDGEDIDDI